jgi:uncharacterized SAM-binding protein YcdF (DUF218 family)
MLKDPAERLHPSPRRDFSRRLGRWFTLALILAAALIVCWVARSFLLQGAAQLWVVSEPVEPADALVVLAGRIDVRPFAAADLYKQGLAPRILISNVARGPIETMQLWPGQTQLTHQLLIKLGIPADAIAEFGMGVSSTYEEARALVDWTQRTGAKSLLIPTDLFTTRRVQWTFRHEVAPGQVRIIVHAVTPHEYALNTWWKEERGLLDFQNEIIKYVYYRFTY